MYAELSSEARGLIFGLSLHLCLYFAQAANALTRLHICTLSAWISAYELDYIVYN